MKESITLKKEFIHGVFYTAIAKYSGILIQVFVTAILARILPPSDFGIIAISTIIINFFSMISEMGIGPAIIQDRVLNKADFSELFGFTIYLGIFLIILLYLGANLIGDFYKEKSLILIVKLLTINLFFVTINIVPNALLLKEKKFKYIAIRTLIIQIITGLLAIIAVTNEFGIFSLLIAPIVSSILVFIVNYLKIKIQPNFLFTIRPIRQIFTFSLFQFLFNFINYFSRNADKIIIGKSLGMKPLGYYDKSYTLMLLPISNITSVLNPVIQPLFSKFQEEKDTIALNYLKIVSFLGLVGFPLSIFLFYSSLEIVLLVFGDQWINAVPVFQIMTLSIAFQIIASSSGSIYQAANATKHLFISGALSAVTIIIGIVIAILVFKNLESVAYSIVITFTINFFQNYFILFNFVLKTNLKSFFKVLLVPTIISVILAIVLFLLQHRLNHNNLMLVLLINLTTAIIVTCLILKLAKMLTK